MDVLEYWSPTIDWSHFKQGSVSDDAWHLFEQLVQLSHAHGHWVEAVRQIRLSPPQRPLYSESKYMSGKRRHEWRREIEQAEGHMHRAAYLGAETIARLCPLAEAAGEGLADWTLCAALCLSIKPFPDHTRGRFKASAFTAFDADAELAGDPPDIYRRWLRNAGLVDNRAA